MTLERRECGDCRACCHAIYVKAIEKPAYRDCPSLCESGCSIYEDKPEACEVYQCLWIQGVFLPEDRPDLSGVIFDGSVSQEIVDSIEAWTGGFLPIVARKVTQDGEWSERSEYLIQWLAQDVKLVILRTSDLDRPEIVEVAAPTPAAVDQVRAALAGQPPPSRPARAATLPEDPKSGVRGLWGSKPSRGL